VSTRQSGRSGLGRGLSALIPQAAAATPAPVEIPIDQIERNPRQPRSSFAEDGLDQLADSIRSHGVLQPIVVTETLAGYQLVAGERRVRAARLAGLDRVPAVIRPSADRDKLELSLVENLQRADLNAIEEASAFQQLVDEFGLTQDEVAARVGRARSTVANTLRLLDLEPPVREAIAAGRISEGHGRAMVGLASTAQRELLALTLARGLSVRQVEELARRLRESTPRAEREPARRTDPELERVEEDLRTALGTKVTLARTRRGGRIVIEYYSDEDLGRLYERLTGGSA
jgi:ParB family transcriptional regulator, chromosome partitioning protein